MVLSNIRTKYVMNKELTYTTMFTTEWKCFVNDKSRHYIMSNTLVAMSPHQRCTALSLIEMHLQLCADTLTLCKRVITGLCHCFSSSDVRLQMLVVCVVLVLETVWLFRRTLQEADRDDGSGVHGVHESRGEQHKLMYCIVACFSRHILMPLTLSSAVLMIYKQEKSP